MSETRTIVMDLENAKIGCPMTWQPIETAPKDRTPFKMFAVIAKDVVVSPNGVPYTTDPYYVWRGGEGFARWPHSFSPTHWHPMPEFEDT